MPSESLSGSSKPLLPSSARARQPTNNIRLVVNNVASVSPKRERTDTTEKNASFITYVERAKLINVQQHISAVHLQDL